MPTTSRTNRAGNPPRSLAGSARAGDWARHFEANLGRREEPDWRGMTPCALEPERRRLLAESLALFQLGETGGGSRLRRFVDRAMEEDGAEHGTDFPKAVDLFLAEEHEHARLLGELVPYLGGKLKRRYWANGIFRRVRAAFGLEFNLQVLLVVELIADAYYGLLSQRVPDAAVRAVCARITREEAGHIGFHRTFFRQRHRAELPGKTAAWSLRFQCLYLLAETLVWREHRPCLLAFGISRRQFTGRGRAACRRFLHGISGGRGEEEENPGTHGREIRA